MTHSYLTPIRALTLSVSLLLSAACDLTHVSAPDFTTNGSLQTPGGALTMRAGAIATFAHAYSDQALLSGLLVDEFSSASYPIDQRIIPSTPYGGPMYPYDELSQARIQLLQAITALELYSPTPAWRIGELFALLANAEIFFAENMCSGVPLGQITNGNPAYGPTLTRDQLLAKALAHLDSANAYSIASDSIRNLVRVSRARAILDSALNAATAAAVIADSVTQGYVFDEQFSSVSAQQNDVYGLIVIEQTFSVSDSEGINGLPFISAGDPRLPKDSIAPGTFGVAADSNYAAPIPLATWMEARLIHAEAALGGGNTSDWLATLNALRADSGDTHVDGLAPLTDPGSPDARASLMFRERAFWLFGSGHRHGDLRRLVRQYGRGTEQVFPTGPYRGGPQQYGTGVVFVPFNENPNPNYRGCFDQKA
jgi:starch-binding outer membrane protein, SusD/RagB family